MKGIVVAGDATYRITDLEFTGGMLVITAVHDGPVAAYSGPVAVFGTDGRGICQGWCVTIPAWAVAGVCSVTLRLPIRIDSLTGAAGS